MGGARGAGGGRAARALRVLLLLVLALAAVEYLFGSILESSSLRTYLYAPVNTTQAARSEKAGYMWPKRTQSRPPPSASADVGFVKDTFTHNTHPLAEEERNTSSPNIKNETTVRRENSVVDASEGTTSLLVERIKDTMKPFIAVEAGESNRSDDTLDVNKTTKMELCFPSSMDSGPIPVNKTDLNLDVVETQYPEVQLGGCYSPPDCLARHKVAIIVPFRDRKQHLAIFLNHMHPFLMRQHLDYGIFIVEQKGNSEFNRAKLMNVGFAESQRSRPGGWDCFIFHDIDLLPLDGRNLYTCPRQPRHMSVAIDKHNFKLPYEDIFGGVSAMTLQQFTNVNGFSNKYWGWGGEDDDMFYRLKKKQYHIARYPMSIARYAMLDHKKQSPNPKRYQLLSQTNKIFQKDGLSSLEYEVIKITYHHLYTNILVNIDEHS